MWSRVLKTPFWSIYTLLPFILYQELNVTNDPNAIFFPVQIMIALQPMSCIFSMYWSALIHNRPDRLVSNIIWSSILGHLPFFFFPFVKSPWFYVFAFAVYMMLHRGAIPAWMEIMKLNLPKASRGRIFAYGSTLGYLGDGIIPSFFLGSLLDGYFPLWRWIFPITAIISLLSVFFQCRIPIKLDNFSKPQTNAAPSITGLFIQPWKKAWDILKGRPDFLRFQVGFMLGGSGLMIMNAARPAFLKGVLHISYTELAIALTLCKGIGFALTSQTWAKWMTKVDIYRFSSLVTIMAFIFPLCLLVAQSNIIWLYLAFIIYGIMQAGSELSWNMSGPIFSRHEDSSVFTSVNVATLGPRGLVATSLGTMLLFWTSPMIVLLVGGGFCLAATACMASYSRAGGEALLLNE